MDKPCAIATRTIVLNDHGVLVNFLKNDGEQQSCLVTTDLNDLFLHSWGGPEGTGEDLSWRSHWLYIPERMIEQ